MVIDQNTYPYENKIITDIGIQKRTNDHIESMCGKCHAKLDTRNEFFKHLEENHHMVISEGDSDDHINRSAKKGAVDKSAAATSNSGSCRFASRSTSKKSAALVIG